MEKENWDFFFFFIKENWDIGTTKKRHGMIEITQIRIRKVAFVLSMSMFVFYVNGGCLGLEWAKVGLDMRMTDTVLVSAQPSPSMMGILVMLAH